MKYHYQFVSRTTVRIELIPADKEDTQLIENLSLAEEDDLQLAMVFSKGLIAYSTGAKLRLTKFMNFPTVALCYYESATHAVETVS